MGDRNMLTPHLKGTSLLALLISALAVLSAPAVAAEKPPVPAPPCCPVQSVVGNVPRVPGGVAPDVAVGNKPMNVPRLTQFVIISAMASSGSQLRPQTGVLTSANTANPVEVGGASFFWAGTRIKATIVGPTETTFLFLFVIGCPGN
jgi:hypothetical protein